MHKSIPLKLQPLFVNKKEIRKISSITFICVIFDEKLNCNEHLKTIENKLSKNIDIFYKAEETINTKAV